MAFPFQDQYRELASFLLYFHDPPIFRLTGDEATDIATLDGLEHAAVEEYLSKSGRWRAVAEEGRSLLRSEAPPWDEIDAYVGARPLDPRDPKGPEGARSWVERVLALLEAKAKG